MTRCSQQTVDIMGSSEFVSVLFPDAARVLVETGLWPRLFPAETQAACPAPTLQASADLPAMRWPELMPLSLAGMIVGLLGCRMLSRQGHSKSSALLHHARIVNNRLWAHSFWWFAWMNFTAIACHNFLNPFPVPNMAFTIWWAVDVGCTAAASATAIVATTYATRHLWMPLPSGHKPSLRVSAASSLGSGYMLTSWVLGPLLLAAAVVGNLYKVPWTSELLYQAAVAYCIAVTARYVYAAYHHPTSRRASRMGLCVAVLGIVFGVSGLSLDPYFCTWFGSRYTYSHQLFLGCDITYAGLLLHLVSI